MKFTEVSTRDQRCAGPAFSIYWLLNRRGVQRGEAPESVTKLQIRNPKRVQGFFPAEGLGVSPRFFLLSPKIGGQGVEFPIITRQAFFHRHLVRHSGKGIFCLISAMRWPAVSLSP